MDKDDFSSWVGLDAAIVGYAHRCGTQPALVYDYKKMIEVFVSKGMSHEEAVEWISFNIEQAYIGEDTPFILETLDGD